MSEWISLKDACDLLGVAPNTIRKLIRTGVLPAFEIKGVKGYQIKRVDVEALITPVVVKPTRAKGKKK